MILVIRAFREREILTVFGAGPKQGKGLIRKRVGGVPRSEEFFEVAFFDHHQCQVSF